MLINCSFYTKKTREKKRLTTRVFCKNKIHAYFVRINFGHKKHAYFIKNTCVFPPKKYTRIFQEQVWLQKYTRIFQEQAWLQKYTRIFFSRTSLVTKIHAYFSRTSLVTKIHAYFSKTSLVTKIHAYFARTSRASFPRGLIISLIDLRIVISLALFLGDLQRRQPKNVRNTVIG